MKLGDRLYGLFLIQENDDKTNNKSDNNNDDDHNKWSKNFDEKAALPSCHPSQWRMDSSDFNPI